MALARLQKPIGRGLLVQTLLGLPLLVPLLTLLGSLVMPQVLVLVQLLKTGVIMSQ